MQYIRKSVRRLSHFQLLGFIQAVDELVISGISSCHVSQMNDVFGERVRIMVEVQPGFQFSPALRE